MHTPSASELLDAWDAGHDAPPASRAVALLAAAWPHVPRAALSALSVGRRDGLLMALRQRLFGDAVAAVAACPQCGERIELAFDVADAIGGALPDTEALVADVAPLTIDVEEYHLALRLPTGDDVAAVADDVRDRPAGPSPGRRLLDRCLLSATRQGQPVDGGELPATVVHRLARHLAEADPHADCRIALACPACAHAWDELFDIGAFLWDEVQAWARRLLADVDLLARTYGWREADVLALRAGRRQHYVELARG